ncbi:MAG: lactate 2-monooxygenase [Pirellulales bacterium]
MKKPSEALADYQFQICRAGLQGRKPLLPVPIERLEELAREKIPVEAFDYIAGGAGSEATMRYNLAAFESWRIVPRMLRDVSRRNLNLELFDTPMPAPLLLAPIGIQSIAHPEGELAVARAAGSLGVPLIYSTAASRSIEDVRSAAGDAPLWFQLYWPSRHDVTKSFLRRAESAGCSALVVTLDTRMLGWRERDLGNAYLPLLEGRGLDLYLTDPVFLGKLQKPPQEDPAAAIQEWTECFSDLSHTFADITRLRESTSLPIILKGIMHPDDARLAVAHGADGVIVSNHGGRQVDGGMAALDALPGVVAAVEGQVPVLFDSGIRRGADVFKALALGAQAVLLGRPYMWGLASAGEDGVREVLQRLLADFDVTMAMSGYASLDELGPAALAPSPRA